MGAALALWIRPGQVQAAVQNRIDAYSSRRMRTDWIETEPTALDLPPIEVLTRLYLAAVRALQSFRFSPDDVTQLRLALDGLSPRSADGLWRPSWNLPGESVPLRAWLSANFPAVPAISTGIESTAVAWTAGLMGAGRLHDLRERLLVHVNDVVAGCLLHETCQGTDSAAAPQITPLDLGTLTPGLLPWQYDLGERSLDAMAGGLGIAQRARRIWMRRAELSSFVAHRMLELQPEDLPPQEPRLIGPTEDAVVSAGLNVSAAPVVSDAEDEFDTGLDRAIRHSALWKLAGGQMSQIRGETVVAAAAQGDRLACQLRSDASRSLSWGLEQTARLLRVEQITIGGPLSGWLFDDLRDQLSQRTGSDEGRPPLKVDHAGELTDELIWRGLFRPVAEFDVTK